VRDAGVSATFIDVVVELGDVVLIVLLFSGLDFVAGCCASKLLAHSSRRDT
jgi:hypothetical protein